ncbi:MAG: thioredoxin domain-containing protein [Ignavibacteriaceae bacterium]
MKVKLEIQYFEGCPNHKKMDDNLKEAIKGLEEKIELTKILVEDDNTAKKVSFRGSPTLLIEGKDVEDLPAPENPSLACRFYPGGVPSAELIRKMIIHKINQKQK